MRRPILAANWKMHKTVGEAVAFAEDFLPRVSGVDDVDIVIAPTATALAGSGPGALGFERRRWRPRT